jgi:hypothetical protein
MKWIKSSRSADTANCVEIAWVQEQVLLRDSKDPEGPMLIFEIKDWDQFLDIFKDE